MELRHIRYFTALAEELNFSRAAERLHIAQPPLSRQIQQLEEEVGVSLFYRTKRHVELTYAGKAFLEKAYQLIDLVDEALYTARMASRAENGKLNIGFLGTAHSILPILSNYREKYPNVSLNLQHIGTKEQIVALQEKRIDIGILTAPIHTKGVTVKKFKYLPLGAVLPANHPLALRGGPVSILELADESFVMYPRSIGSGIYNAIINICHEAGFSPKITVEAHDMQSVLALVSAGMGVSLTTISHVQTKGVVFRELSDNTITLEAAIAYREDEKSEVLYKFLDIFMEYIQKFDSKNKLLNFRT
ncbi:LysR substrate-binding domain-containing protein [Neobacillus pocheonensis]|uniref:LysR substrate-binding domain-containing protein n=1 Tax=Neobacillus pocheonensis TaxID=363869 RepID=UPI003D296AB9